MNCLFPEKTDPNILDTIESSSNAFNLDNLLETSLARLLYVDNVREAEVLLFNKQKKLISVCTAIKAGSKKHKVIAQGWLLDSTVEHTSRRIKVPGLLPVISIPLIESQRLLGFLNIHLNKFRTISRNELANFYLFGTQTASKIKVIMLEDKIDKLKEELQTIALNNRELRQQVTLRSKELYAISAISAKINQSMDFDKSIRKAMTTIRKFFMADSIIIYTQNSENSKPELSAADCEDGTVDPDLLKEIENLYLKELFALDKPFVKEHKAHGHRPNPIRTGEEKLNTIIGVPLKSKNNIIGAIILLHESIEPFNQEGLRLLSGMANIMVMGIDNMNLFRESVQKKRAAEFLVRSIVKFNESLDLKKTLKTVAMKGVNFFGPHCRVYLFSATKAPMIKAEYDNCRGKCFTESRFRKKNTSKEMERIFELMKSKKTPVLIKSVNRSPKISKHIKPGFLKSDIHSFIGVPLYLGNKILGLLLLIRGEGKIFFDNHDLDFAEALGSAASLAIENARTHTTSLEMSEFLEKKILEKTSQIEYIRQQQKIRVENRKDIIFRVNNRNRFVFVNKAMKILTGCSREVLYRGEVNAYDVVAPEDRKRVKNYFRKVLIGTLPTVKGLEYRHLNREGEDHLISLTIYPEKDRLGKIVGIEGVGEDITEKKRLESELEKAKDLALLGEFSSAVAHQIRNPLGDILMVAKLLEKELGMDRPASQHIGHDNQKDSPLNTDRKALNGIFRDLAEGIHNLNQVVSELLEYTKTLKLSRSSQKIEIILQETLNGFRNLIQQHSIKIEEQYDPCLPSLSVDAVLIGHVFQNVIHNAIQAMPDGGRLFLFSGFCRQKPDHIFISINDSGPGIRPSEADKIFRPFYTTKDQGTGLGLSLAHRIIEAHRGMMWVCNHPCHHFVTKPVEMINRTRNPSYSGAAIHILLPINGSAKHNISYRDKSYE